MENLKSWLPLEVEICVQLMKPLGLKVFRLNLDGITIKSPEGVSRSAFFEFCILLQNFSLAESAQPRGIVFTQMGRMVRDLYISLSSSPASSAVLTTYAEMKIPFRRLMILFFVYRWYYEKESDAYNIVSPWNEAVFLKAYGEVGFSPQLYNKWFQDLHAKFNFLSKVPKEKMRNKDRAYEYRIEAGVRDFAQVFRKGTEDLRSSFKDFFESHDLNVRPKLEDLLRLLKPSGVTRVGIGSYDSVINFQRDSGTGRFFNMELIPGFCMMFEPFLPSREQFEYLFTSNGHVSLFSVRQGQFFVNMEFAGQGHDFRSIRPALSWADSEDHQLIVWNTESDETYDFFAQSLFQLRPKNDYGTRYITGWKPLIRFFPNFLERVFSDTGEVGAPYLITWTTNHTLVFGTIGTFMPHPAPPWWEAVKEESGFPQDPEFNLSAGILLPRIELVPPVLGTILSSSFDQIQSLSAGIRRDYEKLHKEQKIGGHKDASRRESTTAKK